MGDCWPRGPFLEIGDLTQGAGNLRVVELRTIRAGDMQHRSLLTAQKVNNDRYATKDAGSSVILRWHFVLDVANQRDSQFSYVVAS